ncbi:enoyl-CoA hydratase/isomerase family protein [Oleomonas cavernae]|uniref:Enoyl-CoA hydratase/isomerase family protein n=1 Tax=Oleomonas cavernae TaxID=2320859 RepID=A0A418W8I1_9PROT|nr:enoyl-CoA hydratase/isomerase family protein [Oleomonas cavernae]
MSDNVMASSADSVACTVEAGLARITLTQAARGNPLDLAFSREMRAVAIELANRDDVRAVLITAQGRFFSVGGDINMFLPDRSAIPGIARRITADLHTAISRFQRMDAPVVTAVQGVSPGGRLARRPV